MRVSFITINRLVERKAAEDAEYRAQIKRTGKATLSLGRALTDEMLLKKLQTVAIPGASREWLDEETRRAPSAEAMASAIKGRYELFVSQTQEDWVWITLTCLWERWFPDRPNLEMLDDGIQEGYAAKSRNEPVETARLWLRTWRSLRQFMAQHKIASVREFDAKFPCTQAVFNWSQDLSLALRRAGFIDPDFARERVEFCKAMLPLLDETSQDELTVENFRHDLAESYAETGDMAEAERLYAGWLRERPFWGIGWMGWSDLFFPFAPSARRDPARAERILTDGLAVPDVRDRGHLLDRLVDLYEQTGRAGESAALRERFRGDGSPPRREGWLSVDQVVAALDARYDYRLPERALCEARHHRDEIVPRLIELIDKGIREIRAGADFRSDGPLFALFLLTEFGAKQALPTILEGLSLPKQGAYVLFGENVGEVLGRVLAALDDEPPHRFEELISNPVAYPHIRGDASRTYLLLVRDGRMTRAEALGRLERHLRDALDSGNVELVSLLVLELKRFAPTQDLPTIREAFDRGLVDEWMADFSEFAMDIEEGEDTDDEEEDDSDDEDDERDFRRNLARAKPTGIQDTIAELNEWDCFRPNDDAAKRGYTLNLPIAPRVREESPTSRRSDPDSFVGPPLPKTVRNAEYRVGRNDPCPCGSGKKYKKCCGAG